MNARRVFLVALIVGLAGISTVQAAEPNNHACLGKSVSYYAQYGATFGDAVSTVAQNPEDYNFNSLGAGVQYILAGGEIPFPYSLYITNNYCD